MTLSGTNNTKIDRVTLICLFLSALLVIGGGSLFLLGGMDRAAAMRGYADPTTDIVLASRLPLGGVNAELTQYDPAALDHELGRIAAQGLTWVRQTFLWSAIEATQGKYDFSRYDAILTAVAKYPSLRIVAVLDSAPLWARRQEASAADRLFAPPASMATFGAFAGAFAAHYKDQIDYYQIWDEPNLNTHWGGLDPRPADYTAMLQAAYEAIRANDPVKTVIAAGLAPTVERGPRNLSDVLFLSGMYQSGAGAYFDAIAAKPYGFSTGPDDRTVDEQVLNFSRIILLREEMVRNGDAHKQVWGSHFGWNSLPAGWSGPPSIWGQVDAETQAQYIQNAYRRAAREWPWIGGLILMGWQPPTEAGDPFQGFDVAAHAERIFENGALLNRPVLDSGYYPATDPRISYVGDWQFGPLGADIKPPPEVTKPAEDGSNNRLTFTFEGDSLAFRVRRDQFVVYMYVTVDGQPANALPRNTQGDAFILLRSPNLDDTTETIVAARGLGAGVHRVEVRVYLGFNVRWLLAGVAIGPVTPDLMGADFNLIRFGGIALLILGLIGLIITARRFPRDVATRNGRQVRDYLKRMGDIFGGFAVSIVAFFGVALTFGGLIPNLIRSDLPAFVLSALTVGALYKSPALIVTLIALAALWTLIFNRPLIGLALNIFFAPFFLQPIELHVYALPMSELCVWLTVTATLARWFVLRGWRAKPGDQVSSRSISPIDLVMIVFVALAALSLTWSEQLAPAIRELRVIVITPVIYYALIRLIRPSRADLSRLVDVLLMSATLVIGIGLIGFVTGSFGVTVAEGGARRLMSVYSSPNNLALFLGRCLPFAAALALIAPRGLRKLAAIAITGLILLGLGLTQSVGALLLGIPAALIVVVLLWDRRKGIILAVVIAVALGGLLLASRFIPRLSGLLDFSRSTSFVRTQVWQSAFNLIRERPVTGAGLDQFLYLYRSRYILPDAWVEPNLSHPHNVILDFWVRLGLGGLILLAAFQWLYWRSGWRALKQWKNDPLTRALLIGALGSMANFLAHGLVDNSYFVLDLSYVFCFSFALIGNLDRMKSIPASTSPT